MNLTPEQKKTLIVEAYQYQSKRYREADSQVKNEALKLRNYIAAYAKSTYNVDNLSPQRFAYLVNQFHETAEIVAVDVDFKIKNWP